MISIRVKFHFFPFLFSIYLHVMQIVVKINYKTFLYFWSLVNIENKPK
jgi:hypothetical protein